MGAVRTRMALVIKMNYRFQNSLGPHRDHEAEKPDKKTLPCWYCDGEISLAENPKDKGLPYECNKCGQQYSKWSLDYDADYRKGEYHKDWPW